MHYLNSGNIFSQSLFVKDFLKQKSHILITHEKKIDKYLKIFDFLGAVFCEISDYSHLIDALYNSNYQQKYIKKTHFILDENFFYTKMPNLWELENKYSFEIKKGTPLSQDELIEKLSDFGYTLSEYKELGSYTKTGDILTICVHNTNQIYKISFWGDVVEEIFLTHYEETQSLESLRIGKKEKLFFFEAKEDFSQEYFPVLDKNSLILDNIDILPNGEKFSYLGENHIFLDILKISHKSQKSLERKDVFIPDLKELLEKISGEKKCIFYTKNKKTLTNFLEYNNILKMSIIETKLTFLKSFETPENIIICDDILSKIFVKKRLKKTLRENIDLLLEIKPGDYIVHIDHGVGVFAGMIQKVFPGKKKEIIKEYLEIHYKNNDKLFVPVTETMRVSKYIGKENPTLTGLSTKEWSKKLSKVSQEVEQIAQELLEIYAQRKLVKGFSFEYFPLQMTEFERSFEYEYTPDQLNAISEILEDMGKAEPMERILVGDVGFGKTEIAFNAIYNAFLNKKQSILISPLVVLAYEHFSKAVERFAQTPLKIELLTRFQTQSEAKNILKKLKNGDIDLIIGTHRLLGENIEYKDLGLLVIDEEHKFGVKEKEKLKIYKPGGQKTSNIPSVDILSLSATPIPRSLHMALGGLRAVSILAKPPFMRKPSETFVSQFDENIIFQAGKKEFERGGQMFFIHNRVTTIEQMGGYLQKIFPTKKIIITHGQLSGDELENRILDFKNKKYDILLSSTVIENGIDFPNVNTIIINDAYRFGLSQIHQLRGRVGRGDKVGYCYLLYKGNSLSPEAGKRLSTLVEYSHLGAGFELALKDLEIRGGGDILGIKQSGMTSEVGMSVYLRLLEEKIEEIKESLQKNTGENEKTPSQKQIHTSIDLNIGAFLRDDFFENELDKLTFYREIEGVRDLEDLENMKQDFIEIHSSLSEDENMIFKLLEVRIKASKYLITSIKRAGVSYEIKFDKNITIEQLKKFLDLDREVKMVVSGLDILKTPCSKYDGDEDFLEYLYTILIRKKPQMKMKLIKKS